MITVTLEQRAMQDVLQRLLARTSDLRPAMAGIGMELENRIRDRIDTQTDPAGRAWIGWADSTIARYPQDGHRRVLDRYGDMIRSLSYRADSSSVSVGFSQPYAAFHEFGTQRMPRRGLLTIDPERGQLAPGDEQAILDILYDLLDDAINAGLS